MSRSPALLLLFIVPLAGCPSAEDRFGEFGGRVTDAATADIRQGQFADISGEHLVGVVPEPINPAVTLQFLATVSLEQNGDGTATAAFSFQPLTVDDDEPDPPDRTPVGEPLPAEGVLISAEGSFRIEASGKIEGEANPISGTDIRADFILDGVINDEDSWCGLVGGEVTQPPVGSLEGSTFGAVRVEPGTLGDDLPPPPRACPEGALPDAGPPDATPGA